MHYKATVTDMIMPAFGYVPNNLNTKSVFNLDFLKNCIIDNNVKVAYLIKKALKRF